MSDRILIACIGNVFLGDDGFGVEVARALAATQLPAEVTVVDYGIRGLDLAYAMLDPWQAVVIVDAVARGGQPGTLYGLKPDDQGCTYAALDPHSMDPVSVLNMAQMMGKVQGDIYILGCEPRDFGDEVEGRMGLSAAVQAAVPDAARMTTELVMRIRGQAALESVGT